VRISVILNFAVKLLIFSLVLNHEAIIAQVNKSVVGKDHLLGVIEAHVARLSSWETGDVLVRIRTTGTGVASRRTERITGPDSCTAVFQETVTMRFVFDFPQKRFVAVINREREINAFDALDNEIKDQYFPERRRTMDAFLIDQSRSLLIVRNGAGQSQQVKPTLDRPIFEVYSKRFGLRNIKGVGIYGWTNTMWDDQGTASFFNLLFNADVIESVTHVGKDRYRTLSRVHLPRANVKGYRRMIDWDVVHGVPVAYYDYPGFDDDAKPAHNSGQVEWREQNSQMVPVKARENDRRLQFSASMREFAVDLEAEVDFHWFSINEELDAEQFDEKRFQEPGRLNQLLTEYQFEAVPEKQGGEK